MPGILHYLRSFRHLPPLPEGDGELLQRFRLQRDELAFATLVQRHGPMVLGIARRVLGTSDTAEDIFQATFLVLARRGRHLETWPTVAGWLVQVARRTALQARAKSARRSRHEHQAAAMTDTSTTSDPQQHANQRDLAELLDAELAKLPSKYRTPLVLCQLQGQTKEETARQLGWPVGSVSGRLARGKKLLQDRLLRRGFVPTVVASALTMPQLEAHLPNLLVQATTLLASNVVHQSSKVSASAAVVLAQGVMTSMFVTKLKYAAAVLVTLALFLGTGAWALSGKEESASLKVQAPRIEAKASTLLEQLQGKWVVEKSNKTIITAGQFAIRIGNGPNAPMTKLSQLHCWSFQDKQVYISNTWLFLSPEEDRFKYMQSFDLNESTSPAKIVFTTKNRGIIKLQDGKVQVSLEGSGRSANGPSEFQDDPDVWTVTLRRANDYDILEGIWCKEERNPVTNEIENADELIFKKNMYVRRTFRNSFAGRIGEDKPRQYVLNETTAPKQIDLDIKPVEEINAGYANQLNNENDRGGLGRSSFINNTVKKDKILERQVGIYELKDNTFTFQISGAIPFKYENEKLVPNPQSPLNKRPTTFTLGDNATDGSKSFRVTYKRVERSMKDGNNANLSAPAYTEPSLGEAKAPSSPQLQDLRQQRLKLAQERMNIWNEMYKSGRASLEESVQLSHQLLDAQLALAKDSDTKVKSFEEHLKILRQLEVFAEKGYQSGARTKSDWLAVKLRRIEVEIQLEEMKTK